MDWKLEVVVVPVTDVDRAKRFYAEQLGFNVDVDDSPTPDVRVVQLTPPGSACSIVVGVGIGDPDGPRVINLHLVVDDVAQAREQLAGRGVDVSAVSDMGGVKYAFFGDPDGNTWALQELLH